MELDRLRLKGYKPTALSGITEIDYTPESPYQLILGTNGCGKSSLLSQLSMLPAVPGDYHEGGYKIWEGTHNGKRYRLESHLGKKTGRHNFIVIDDNGNEEELNPGGTGQVQKELVYQHTGLTGEILDIALGRTVQSKFVNMSPARRQEWFQVLSPVDIKEGMEAYQSFMSRSRQMSAVHKHAMEQIPEVSKSLLPSEERTVLETEIRGVKELLTAYMEAKIPLGASNFPPDINRLESLSREVLAMRVEDFGNYRNYGELQSAVQAQRGLVASYQQSYERTVSEFYDLDKKIRSLGGVSDDELEAQRSRVELLSNQLNQFNVPGTCLVSDSQAVLVSQILRDRINDLADLLVQLPVTKPEYGKDRYIAARERITVLEKEIDKAVNRMQHLQMELRRIETTQDVECPSCKVQFKPGIGSDMRSQIMAELTGLDTSIGMMRTELSDTREFVEEVDVWRNCRQNISRALAEESIAPYRAAIIDSPHFSVAPKNLLADVRHWMTTLNAQIERFNLQTELSSVQTAYQLAVAANNNARQQNLTLLNEQYARLEQDMAGRLSELNQAKEVLGRLVGVESLYLRRDNIRKELGALFDETMQYEVHQAKLDFNRRMSELIGEAQSRLAYLENRLRAADQAQDTLDRLKENMKDAANEALAAAELATIMSPKEGLIAEYLSSSVNTLVATMNATIRKVWTYELEVLPCGIDSGELNYKFPLQIRGEEDNTVSDISIGSDSQQGIINLAFRLLMMKYLGLKNFPLYLDEFGREFDETHAVRAMMFIKFMVEAGHVSQIFLISHNPSLHAMFTLADVNILHKDNVTVTENHNHCLTVR